MTDDDTEDVRTLMERIALAFETTQHANADALHKLHSLATTRSVMHLTIAIIAMVIIGGLLYWGQERVEARALSRWETLGKVLEAMPHATAREFNIIQKVNIEGGGDIREKLSREILRKEGKL